MAAGQNLCPGLYGFANLPFQRFQSTRMGQRPHPRFRQERIAHPQRLERRHHPFDKAVVNLVVKDKPLRRNAGLPGILRARLYALPHGLFPVCAGHDQERIATAQFQHGPFYFSPRRARHGATGGETAGQGDGGHARVLDERLHAFDSHRQILETALFEAGVAKNRV